MGRDRQSLDGLVKPIVLACVLHAFAGASIWRAHSAPRAELPAAAVTELALDLSSNATRDGFTPAPALEAAADLRPPEPSHRLAPEPRGEDAPPAPTHSGGTATSRRVESEATATTAEGAANAPTEGPAAAGARDWSFSATKAAPVDVLGGGILAREPNPDASHTRALAPGEGVGGAVLAETEDAVRTSLAPDEGRALFSVVVWKNGDVHAALLEASSANEQWSRVLGAVEAAVKRRGVRIPSGAKGVLIEMTLESAIRYVDGRRPANAGTKAVVQGLGRDGSVMDQMPMIGVHHEGRYCVAAAGITPAGLQLGGGCSPENGVPATRQVRGRITKESRID